MGWLDTPEEKRRQHVQIIGAGSINDLDRIHERDRRRRINFVLWFLFIISALGGISLFKTGLVNDSFYFWGFAILMLVIILFRYGLHRKIKLGKKSGGWERIERLPDWAYKKMKRKHKHHVNGEHYVYKKEGSNFYRKLR